ncbi:uncharacterized protein DEA37_0005017, partial [Paragonimus westermani]
MKLPQLQKIMMDFEKESGLLDSKEEMMTDAIDDALGEDDLEESENVVNAVSPLNPTTLMAQVKPDYSVRLLIRTLIHEDENCTGSKLT